MKGKILVTIQFTCLALLGMVTNWLTLPWWVFILLAVSALLAFRSMAIMKFGNFNIIPNPVVDGTMVSSGPYRLIRHPMYTSIFIFSLALTTGQFDFTKLGISLLLVADLLVKMHYEESLLCKHYPGYKDYMKITKRVIPFVW